MQHPTSTALSYEGHLSLPLALKFVFFAALGAFLIVMQSLALLLFLAFCFAMGLAIQQRLHKLDGQHSAQVQPAKGYWVSDGGSFPSRELEAERQSRHNPCVIDGGSLEHHRS
jgi:hypothetical protein